MTVRSIIGAGALALLFGTVAAMAAEPGGAPAPTCFQAAENASLCVVVPAGWMIVDDSRQRSSASFNVVFQPANGDGGFKLLLTALTGPRQPSDDDLRAITDLAKRDAAESATETVIEVKELFGESLKGWYFSATDRAPKAGEYKHLTQGTARVGKLLLTFTVLSHRPEAATVALGMLKGASLQAGATPTPQ